MVLDEEKVEGEELQKWLNRVVAPEELAVFIKGKQAALLPEQASSSSHIEASCISQSRHQ